nr:hypothetical protein [Leptospira sp. P2653]
METYQRPTQGKYRPGPIDILKMTRSKKDLLSKIAELDINGRSQYGGCVTKNKKLGIYVDLAETTVSKYIREFRKEKLVHQTSFHGSYRILRISDELYFAIIEERTRNIELAKSKKEAYNNPSLDPKPSTNGPLTQGQGYGAAPYNNPPPSRTFLKTSVPTYVPAIFDETGDVWKRFLTYSDERLTKSSRIALHELKVNSDGKTLTLSKRVSDSLLNLISKYFAEEAKLKLIVKIQPNDMLVAENNDSNLEPEKNRGESSVPKTQNSEISIMPQNVMSETKIEYEYFYNIRFRDEVIRGFLDYSSLKLERSDLDILRNVRIHYNFEKITFFDPIPERLKNHIREYFLYKTKSVIAPVFVEKPWNTQLASAPLQNQKGISRQMKSNYIPIQSREIKKSHTRILL